MTWILWLIAAYFVVQLVVREVRWRRQARAFDAWAADVFRHIGPLEAGCITDALRFTGTIMLDGPIIVSGVPTTRQTLSGTPPAPIPVSGGFTQEDVGFLRELIESAPLELLRTFRGRVGSLADRIEALLPPEPK